MGKLHDRMQEDLLLKAYSPHAQRAYLGNARHFARHYLRSPEEMSEQEIRGFLLYLVRDRKASPATLGMYVNALKFLYNVTLKRPEAVKGISHPKRPKTLPVILSPEEVLRILAAIRSVKHKAIVATAYAAGLRISEVCGLRLADIDSQRYLSMSAREKGKKIALSCWGKASWPCCASTTRKSGRKESTCSRDKNLSGPSPPRPCAKSCGRLSGRRVWRSGSPCTLCATVLPPICWRPAPTSASSRSSWATAPSAPPCGIPTSPTGWSRSW